MKVKFFSVSGKSAADLLLPEDMILLHGEELDERGESACRSAPENARVQLSFDVADQGALYERFAQALRGGAMPAFEVSMMKVWASETLQRLTEALVDAVGSAGAIAGAQRFGGAEADVVSPFLDTRAFTILGGTNQIQRNILAKQVLRLP